VSNNVSSDTETSFWWSNHISKQLGTRMKSTFASGTLNLCSCSIFMGIKVIEPINFFTTRWVYVLSALWYHRTGKA